MMIRLITVLALLWASPVHFARAQQPDKMINADVTALVDAGLSDDIIIAKIHAASTTNFDTSVAGLKSLQAAHVSTAVIQAMIDPRDSTRSIQPQGAASGATDSRDDPATPHPPGIYLYATFNAGHTLTELQRVTPNQAKHTGAFVRAATHGIMSSKNRAVLEGAHAPVKSTDANPAFYLYDATSNGSFGGSYFAPRSFTLVKFARKNDTREIVEGSFNILGGKSGIEDKAKQGFTAEQLKPGVYKLTLAQPLPPGEYAFEQGGYTFFDFEIAQ